MHKKILLLLFFAFAITAVAGNAASTQTSAAKRHENLFSQKILNAAKTALAKLERKQDCSLELKTIVSAQKDVREMQLKTVTVFAGQQAALQNRKASSTELAELEIQRKKINLRYNEFIRLIDQVNKNQKTALLPEKLKDLILFLEPATPVQKQNQLSRGQTPVRQNAQDNKK